MTVGSQSYQARHWPPARWFAWVAAGGLILLGVVLALAATQATECCDAGLYRFEATALAENGWRSDWLSSVHNYAYPAFLAILSVFGVEDRFGVGFVQVSLLYATALVLVMVLARYGRASPLRAMLIVCALMLLPAAAFSGYTLSEALAAPVLILILAACMAASHHLLSGAYRYQLLLVAILGVVAGLAWMVRPQLVFVPAVIGLVVATYAIVMVAKRSLRAIPLLAVFGVALLLVVLPQIVTGEGPFKLHLAETQSSLSWVVWRYATNLSECGPNPLVFTPFGPDFASIVGAAEPSISWKITAVVAHLVTGWDALPGPSYVTSLVDDRWVVVTAASGFILLAPAAAAWILWRRWRHMLTRPEIAFLSVALVLFVASQLVLALSMAEFRFNLAGWLVAGTCLALLMGWSGWDRVRVGLFLAGGLLLSSTVFIIGQMTLRYSPHWIACSG